MIGETVSHYKILEKLGEGGMGVVYKAEDTKLGRTVAIKFLPSELTRDAKAKQRFIQEARAASAMDHSNICTIFEVDETKDGRMFICMACYQGKTLKERIADGPLELREAIDIAMQVAQGLARAHSQGIVHRDIKPANIFLTDDGQVKIVDFGLAKLAGQLKLTSTGKTMGTVAYMSPEQGRGEEVGPKTDIWALGVVLYEMVTGQLPFAGDYDVALMYSIMNEEAKPMGSLRAGVPAELEEIAKKALAKNPAHRYEDANGMRADLESLRMRMTFDERTASRGWNFNGRERRLWPALTAAAGIVAVLAIVWLVSLKRERQTSVLTGQPFQVTSGDAWQGEPALSPDGGSIAFTSDASGNKDIYIMDVGGGNPLQLTSDPASDHSPVWFPDGTAIAFVSERGCAMGVWKVGRFGGGATVLLQGAMDPAISLDGRLAFSKPGPGGYLRIGVASIDDPTKMITLTGDDDGIWNHSSAAWSPDGRMICYSAQDGLWLVSSSGGPARPLTTEGRMDASPAWSSNGKYIYFSSLRGGPLALWRIAASGGVPKPITMGSGSEHDPFVSKDGSRLAYMTQTSHLSLFLRDMRSGKETKLPGLRDDYMAALAPDGSTVVYTSDRGGTDKDLWAQPLRGGIPTGQPQRLTEEKGDASHPVFSADGKWLAYYRKTENLRDIYTIPASGGQPIQFTDDPANEIQPAWSPDGSMLAFVSDRGGGSHIWIAPVKEGKPAGPPKRLSGDTLTALAPAWSPDGKLIAFVGANQNRSDVWVTAADGSGSARELTRGANAQRVRWDPSAGSVLATGSWCEDWYSLRRLPLDGADAVPVVPPVNLGPLTAPAMFDISRDGRFMVFSREEIKGNIWVLKAKKGVY
jgi:Tol biopolymer transport system component